MNEITHAIHNLEDENGDLDLMKFVQEMLEKSSYSPQEQNMIVKLVNYKKMETERHQNKNEAAVHPSIVLQNADKFHSFADAINQNSASHPLTEAKLEEEEE